jgi:hypothetical protein
MTEEEDTSRARGSTLIGGRSEDDVIEAIFQGMGIKTAIAKKLGCGRSTLDALIRSNPRISEAYTEALDHLLDAAEHKLVEQVLKGDMKAIRYLLDTKGRARGYGQPFRLQVSQGVRMTPDERRSRFNRVAFAMGYELPEDGVIDVTPEDEQESDDG